MAKLNKATFAAGCFWGIEAAFRKVSGVVHATVGYTGGQTDYPTYQDVCSGQTGHAEAVMIKFDPDQVSYAQLLETFFKVHDPTTLNRQGPDIGSQYRSAIFYHSEEQKSWAEFYVSKFTELKAFKSPIVTQIVPAGQFYPAEEYHQRYLEKRGIGT